MAMSTLPSPHSFAKPGRLLDTNFSCGFSFETDSGQQHDCSWGGGIIIIFVSYVKGIWKPRPTYSSNALFPSGLEPSGSLEWCQNLQPSRWSECWSNCKSWFLAITKEGTKAAHTLPILTLCCIWKQQNAIVFRESRRTTQTVSLEVRDVCSLWSMAGRVCSWSPF